MSFVALRLGSVALALALDLAIGDPQNPWHPVRLLGSLAGRLEEALRRRETAEDVAGAALAALVVFTAAVVALTISTVAARLGAGAGLVADALLIYFAVAGGALAREGSAVGSLLRRGDLPAARTRVSGLVGRDTQSLDESGVSRATVETIGENAVDALVAPVFWAVLLGPAGAWVHKAASTLDSMVGYRNERYARFGTAAARLDDVLAFLPARLSVPLISLATLLVGLDPVAALRVGWRDRLNHASPNSAHGEASFAGALGVRLGGEVSYSGVVSQRPVIGEGLREPVADDIARAVRLLLGTEALLLLPCAALALAAAQ